MSYICAYFLVSLLAVTRQTVAEVREARFVQYGSVEGRGASDAGQDTCGICTSAGGCASTCMEPTCKGFVVSDTNDEEPACLASSNPSTIPPGYWQTYCKSSHTGNLVWGNNLIPFIRRFDGSENFNRTWLEYNMGFGDRCQEFWLGLETIHQLTSGGGYGLTVYMEAFDGATFWAEYSSFSVTSEADNYRLQISGYNPASTGGDSLQGVHNNRLFTTWDRDNDNAVVYNAAYVWYGGWWYDMGAVSKATGRYELGGQDTGMGINWYTVYDGYYSFKTMEMALMRL